MQPNIVLAMTENKGNLKKVSECICIRPKKHYFTRIRLQYLNLKYTINKKLKIQSVAQEVKITL